MHGILEFDYYLSNLTLIVLPGSGICQSEEEEDPTLKRLGKYFKPLAKCYKQICAKVNEEREFYGLRDYYWYVVCNFVCVNELELIICVLFYCLTIQFNQNAILALQKVRHTKLPAT